MSADHARRMILAHERAAASASSPEKRMQHIRAIECYRKTYGLPEPVSFGRDEHTAHRQHMAREERARIRSYKQTGVIEP